MELPLDAPAPTHLGPKSLGVVAEEWTIAVSVAYSLILATGGGYVFYASIRPVSIQTGYGAVFFDLPWAAAYLLLVIVWLPGWLMLLALGLRILHQTARLKGWLAIAWVGAVAAGMAIGVVILRDFDLLFTAYRRGLDGSPLGPSRFAPAGPYWPALIAAGGQLAVGAVMIALANALRGKTGTTAPSTSVTAPPWGAGVEGPAFPPSKSADGSVPLS